jgi:LacI family transcriptional regulator
VFLILPSHQEANREIIRGIYDYALPEFRWAFFHVNQTVRAIEHISHLKTASGIIGLLGREDLAEAAAKSSLPVVNIHDGDVYAGLPQVGEDGYLVGAYAAECLQNTGAEYVGFYGLKGANFSEVRCRGFCDKLEELGRKDVNVFFRDPAMLQSMEHFGERNPALEWLENCPKPIAIYCANDTFANELSVACFQANLSIPQEVMLLGTDNDSIWAKVAHPSLLSIQLPYQQIGRQAAQMLQQLMERGGIDKPLVRIHQPELVERQSTARVHTSDPLVEKALLWMQEHGQTGASMQEVAKVAGCSTRGLEIRFRKALGRSPGTELKRIRLTFVKQLLREGDLTIEAIAEDCNFSSGAYLSQFFKRETGVTPGAYRKTFRL